MTEKQIKNYILRMAVMPEEFGVIMAHGVNPKSARLSLPDEADFKASADAAREVAAYFVEHSLNIPNISGACLALYADLLNAYCLAQYHKPE